MENADRKVPFASHPMTASICRPPSRRLKCTQNLQGFTFVYLFLVYLTAVSGSLEGRFQQTSQPGFFAPSSIDELLRELGLQGPSLSLSTEVYEASNGYNHSYLNLGQPFEVARSKSTEDSELPVLNLTLATIRFFQNLDKDDIMDISSGDSENPYKTLYVSKLSDLASVDKKHRGLRDYLKARISSKPNIVSVDENLERRVTPTTGSQRLAFLKGLRSLTKRTHKTTTPLNIPPVRQDYETSHQSTETSTKSITEVILGHEPSDLDGENVSVNSGGRSIKDMFGMIGKLKKSTAFPQSDGSESILSRSRNEQDSTTRPKDGLSFAFRNFLREGVRSSKVNLRVGSLANDSIGLLPDETSNIDIPSIRSNSFVSNDSKVSTLVPTLNASSENTISSTTTRIVDLVPIKEKLGATSEPVMVNKTSIPTSKVLNNSTQETTKLTFTTTIASTSGNVLIRRKNTTFNRSETTSPVINQTENLPVTESQHLSSILPSKKLSSAAEESENQKFTTKLTEQTSIDFQTSRQQLKISSTKSTTDFKLITDDRGWERNSTTTLETPRTGPIVEKEPLTIYADTAGITVCLVILCVGLLLFVIGIYCVCQSSKPRDSDNNVQPYSARRFSDA